MIESCLAIAIIALVFFTLLQVSQLLAAREILAHAAARGARARTVGFNHWMVTKVINVAAIPSSGRMLAPADFVNEQQGLRTAVETGNPGSIFDYALRTTPTSPQYAIERGRIPEYLGAENEGRAAYLLDYDHWDDLGFWDRATASGVSGGGDTVHVRVYQDLPLWVPMHRAIYADDTITLAGDSYIENHYPLYLEDQNW